MRIKPRVMRHSPRWIVGLSLLLLWSVSGWTAPPPLTADRIRDLRALEERLEAGEIAQVAATAQQQAQRLEGGNAADRWARALYLQLASAALAREGQLEEAAERLSEARAIDEADEAQQARWLNQEARLRLRAGQLQNGSELLARWLQDNPSEAEALWLMAQAKASLGEWQDAATWLDRALEHTPSPSESQLSLAATIYQRTERDGKALQMLDALLDEAPDDTAQWRRAAGLAQRMGADGQAAALWEAGWQQGVLKGADDLMKRVQLHLTGGTPARAAEILSAALEEGELEDTLERRRLLAQAWTAARDRDHALAAWQYVARHSDQGEDWLQLGQLAHGWGRDEIAREALLEAQSQGIEAAKAWLGTLDTDTQ